MEIVKKILEKIEKDREKGKMTKPILSDAEATICKNLVLKFYEIQEVRKGMTNALNMTKRDYPDFDTTEQAEVVAKVEDLEKDLKKEIVSHISSLKIYGWMQSIEGIGPIISAGLISGLQDPARFDNPAKLWRYCGLSPVDWCESCDKRFAGETKKEREAWAYREAKGIEERKAKSKKNIKAKQKELLKKVCDCESPSVVQVAEKRRKGLPIHYKPFLKTLCFKIGEMGFVRHKGYYRDKYDEFRAYEDKNYPNLSKGHRYARAKRKTVKLYLSHLWNAWRRINGESITTPYVIKMGGHNYIAPPNEEIIDALAKLD